MSTEVRPSNPQLPHLLETARECAAKHRKLGYSPYRTVNASWLVRLDDEIERLTRELEAIHTLNRANVVTATAYANERDASDRQIERLRAALRKYGKHSFECVRYDKAPGIDKRYECVCGLDRALEAAPADETTAEQSK
jgi:hypothetical protein